MDDRPAPEQPQTPRDGGDRSPAQAVALRALSPKDRRRALLRTAFWVLALDLAMLGLYSVLPIRGGWGVGPIVELFVVLSLFVLVLATQIRAIGRSRLPLVRAAATLGVVIPLFFIVCALAYLAIESSAPGSFTQPINRVAAMYFTITVFATVGFGDISAATDFARVAVSVQMVLDLILIGAVAQLILSVAKDSLSRSQAAGQD